jgi:hypothetical protein
MLFFSSTKKGNVIDLSVSTNAEITKISLLRMRRKESQDDSFVLLRQFNYKLSASGSGPSAPNLVKSVNIIQPKTSPILNPQYTLCPTVTLLHRLFSLSTFRSTPFNHSSHP